MHDGRTALYYNTSILILSPSLFFRRYESERKDSNNNNNNNNNNKTTAIIMEKLKYELEEEKGEIVFRLSIPFILGTYLKSS